jgi:hypothetical protein
MRHYGFGSAVPFTRTIQALFGLTGCAGRGQVAADAAAIRWSMAPKMWP